MEFIGIANRHQGVVLGGVVNFNVWSEKKFLKKSTHVSTFLFAAAKVTKYVLMRMCGSPLVGSALKKHCSTGM